MNLQRMDWIQAALRALASRGVEGVRVESLARDLGVSKGSFYWHFRDRAELLEAVLASWEESTWFIITAVETEPAGPARLRRLMAEVSRVSRPSEQKLHAWAAKDPAVAERVAAVEHRRMEFITLLFREAGISAPEEARRRAEIAYLIYLGWMNLAGRDPAYQARPHILADGRVLDLLLHEEGGRPC